MHSISTTTFGNEFFMGLLEQVQLACLGTFVSLQFMCQMQSGEMQCPTAKGHPSDNRGVFSP